MKWRTAVDRALDPLGLTHAQYSILASLFGVQRRGDRPSQRRLAEHVGLDPIYVSKLVRTLDSAGLVDRLVDDADARAVQLVLTDHGRDVARRAIAVVADLLEQLTKELGGTRSRRTRTLAHEIQTLLAAPDPSDPRRGDRRS